jgi:hypothetical protein
MAKVLPESNALAFCINFDDGNTMNPCPSVKLPKAVREMQTARIEVEADEVTMEVSGLYCSDVNGCKGLCVVTMTQTIRSMVRVREVAHN